MPGAGGQDGDVARFDLDLPTAVTTEAHPRVSRAMPSASCTVAW